MIVKFKIKVILSSQKREIAHKFRVHHKSIYRQTTIKRTRMIQVGVFRYEWHEQFGEHIFAFKELTSLKVQVNHELFVDVITAE